MISWIIIGVLIVLLLVFAKLKHIRHKTFLIILVLLLLFFYISASAVIKNQNIDLGSFGGIVKASSLYFNWLVHLGGNAKQLAGNALKMDWVGNVSSSG